MTEGVCLAGGDGASLCDGARDGEQERGVCVWAGSDVRGVAVRDGREAAVLADLPDHDAAEPRLEREGGLALDHVDAVEAERGSAALGRRDLRARAP